MRKTNRKCATNKDCKVKTVVKYLIDHDVYLNIKEKLSNDKEDIIEPPPKIMKKTHSTDYENYAYVLPSARTIADYKHL